MGGIVNTFFVFLMEQFGKRFRAASSPFFVWAVAPPATTERALTPALSHPMGEGESLSGLMAVVAFGLECAALRYKTSEVLDTRFEFRLAGGDDREAEERTAVVIWCIWISRGGH